MQTQPFLQHPGRGDRSPGGGAAGGARLLVPRLPGQLESESTSLNSSLQFKANLNPSPPLGQWSHGLAVDSNQSRTSQAIVNGMTKNITFKSCDRKLQDQNAFATF